MPEVKTIRLNISDSLFLQNQIALLNKNFNDTLIRDYKVSDTLYSFLSNFNAEQYVLYNVSAAHFDLRLLNVPNLIWFSRVFVVDMRNKKIIYYSFKKVYGQGGEDLGWLYFMPNQKSHFPLLTNSLKCYIRYLKKNEKYLNEKGVKWK